MNAQRVAGAVTDDPETIKVYFGYAHRGRSALWVHVPDDADADRAVRCLGPTTKSSTSATTATAASTTSTSNEASASS